MANAASYLQYPEYVIYGIADADVVGTQIDAASRIVNQYLNRPEGLIWMPDANGNPCYMAAKTGRLVTVPGAIAPGANVVVTLPQGCPVGLNNIGDVVVLDKGNPSAVEGAIITAVSGNTITLAQVLFAHSAGFTLTFDLLIGEEKPVPPKRSTVRLSRWPLVSITSMYGRYAYGRRSQSVLGMDASTNLLAYVAAFGGPPMWQAVPTAELDYNSQSGEIWIPPGILLAYFTDVRVRYVAGFSAANVPGEIKTAVANIVRALIDVPMLGNMKMIKSGDVTLERFGPNVLDDDTKGLLEPYKARSFA